MSHDLSLAQSDAFQLSRDMMVPVTVFDVDGEHVCECAAAIDRAAHNNSDCRNAINRSLLS